MMPVTATSIRTPRIKVRDTTRTRMRMNFLSSQKALTNIMQTMLIPNRTAMVGRLMAANMK